MVYFVILLKIGDEKIGDENRVNKEEEEEEEEGEGEGGGEGEGEGEEGRRVKRKRREKKNNAGYTATPVTCGWAGDMLEVT